MAPEKILKTFRKKKSQYFFLILSLYSLHFHISQLEHLDIVLEALFYIAGLLYHWVLVGNFLWVPAGNFVWVLGYTPVWVLVGNWELVVGVNHMWQVVVELHHLVMNHMLLRVVEHCSQRVVVVVEHHSQRVVVVVEHRNHQLVWVDL